MSDEPTSRVILCMSISFDGFVARSDSVIDWLVEPEDRALGYGDRRHRATLELLGQVGLIAIGRGAYEDMVKGWPGSDNPMAVLMNTLPHDKDIVVFGGARFAHSLIEHRLIDEYRLTVHPVILGEGLSLMHDLPEPQRLRLIGSTAYADGCVTQVYVPRVIVQKGGGSGTPASARRSP